MTITSTSSGSSNSGSTRVLHGGLGTNSAVNTNQHVNLDIVLSDDITTPSKHLDKKQLSFRFRSLAERIHLNMENAYKRYRNADANALQQVEESIRSPIREIDVQETLRFLNPIPNLGDEHLLWYPTLNGSLDEVSHKVNKQINSIIGELEVDLEEEYNRRIQNINLLTAALESKGDEISASFKLHLQSIRDRIESMSNQRFNLLIGLPCIETCPSKAEIKAIEAKIKELDTLLDEEWKREEELWVSRSVEINKAREATDKEIENERNKSDRLSDGLRNRLRSLQAFKEHWRDYVYAPEKK